MALRGEAHAALQVQPGGVGQLGGPGGQQAVQARGQGVTWRGEEDARLDIKNKNK